MGNRTKSRTGSLSVKEALWGVAVADTVLYGGLPSLSLWPFSSSCGRAGPGSG